MNGLLTYTIFAPLAGIPIILLLNRARTRAIKVVGIASSLLAFVCSIGLYAGFVTGTPGFQFTEATPWIASLNVFYAVGVDGLSLLLVLLTTFLTPLALLSSWDSIAHRIKEYTIMILVLEVGTVR